MLKDGINATELEAGNRYVLGPISINQQRRKSDRYFTPKIEAGQEPEVPLNKAVDPKGVLLQAAGSDFVHLDDNVVVYTERHTRGDSFR